jgi:hypothetical protein
VADLAIVDSRNVHGAAKTCLGFARTPSVAGVIAGLASYGFAVAEVHVALALARTQDQGALAQQHSTNTTYMNEVLADARGRVLLGELHRKDQNRVEEKIVDVQLALDIARHAIAIRMGSSPFDRIIVVSQDIDLTPALDYALDQLHVPIVVVADGVIDNRRHPYVLLTANVLAAMTGAPKKSGHFLRYLVATCAMNSTQEDWEVTKIESAGDVVIRRLADRLYAKASTSALAATPAVGDILSLFASRVDVGRKGNLFPSLRCAPIPPAQPLLQRGVVLGRQRRAELLIRLPSKKTVRLRYLAGGVVPGTEVALATWVDAKGQPKKVVVGPLLDPSNAADALHADALSARPISVVVGSSAVSGTRVEAASQHGPVALEHGKFPRPKPGATCHAVLVPSTKVGILPLAFPVTRPE